MSALNDVKKRLRPGQVYRRQDFEKWSNAVDRHLRQLVEEGRLEKVSGGLYLAPRQTRYGKAPARPEKLVESFLKDDRFLLVSPNAYNGLGVGTTSCTTNPLSTISNAMAGSTSAAASMTSAKSPRSRPS